MHRIFLFLSFVGVSIAGGERMFGISATISLWLVVEDEDVNETCVYGKPNKWRDEMRTNLFMYILRPDGNYTNLFVIFDEKTVPFIQRKNTHMAWERMKS